MPTLQRPIGSGFGAASTAADVIKGLDLSGRVAMVSGGYSGLGLETTRVLRSAGARVVVPARDHERGKAEGVRAFSLHPGSIVSTDLKRYLSEEELRAAGVIDEYGNPILDPARGLKTVQQGAATSVWCATSPQLNGMGGVYCENCDIAPLVPRANDVKRSDEAIRQVGSMALGVMPHAVDRDAADRLWNLSERLTGSAIQ